MSGRPTQATGPSKALVAKRRQVGARLQETREYLGFSAEGVAKLLELPLWAVENIENGTRRLEAHELVRLCTLYKQPETLFTGEIETTNGCTSPFAELAAVAEDLSDRDREELTRLADYLQARALVAAGHDSQAQADD